MVILATRSREIGTNPLLDAIPPLMLTKIGNFPSRLPDVTGQK